MKDESVTSAGGGGQGRDVSESTRISPNHVRDKVPEYENQFQPCPRQAKQTQVITLLTCAEPHENEKRDSKWLEVCGKGRDRTILM